VQLAKFDAAGARRVRDEVARLVGEQHKDVFPTSAYGPLIDARQLYAVEAGDLPWTEIDSLGDYDRAVQQVLPRLQAMKAVPAA
jgi:NDP-sugar pyrophosphorylase family protein